MKFIIQRLLIVITCIVLCITCTTKKNQLSVIHTNFDGEIEQQQNLVFAFNKDIYPDSLLQSWDSTDYIEFNPAVKGMFKWNSSSELMFSPSQGFQPGTEYTATLTSFILNRSIKKYSFDKESFHFHTAPLRITDTHLSYTRGKNTSNVMVQLDMNFNYEVKLNEAATHLQLSSNGNAISIMTANDGAGKTLSLQFVPVSNRDEETPLTIKMKKGIAVTIVNIFLRTIQLLQLLFLQDLILSVNRHISQS